ncbi:MAG: hypothetical protein CL582_23460 [Alteromonadaceae bacterium]|nr:hypothetical protein [Alteromonadaceae bacterium]|tara:strand:- start:1139 stop:1570 length:432 start_codon:yes stop_codon:yes gene_type:complete
MAYSPQNAIGNQFQTLTKYFGDQRHTYDKGRFLQTGDSGGTAEYSTIGPERNEIFTTYTYAKGTHHVRFLAYVSPDILLVHQSKVAGFYRAVSSGRVLDPVERSVKDQILKDARLNITGNTMSVSASVSAPITTTSTTTSGSY